MEFHPIVDGPLEFLVTVAEHAAVTKGQKFAADIRVAAGQNIHMPAAGKIPHVYRDVFDGGKVGGSYFGIDITPEKKGDPLVKFLLAHLVAAEPFVRRPAKGDVIGHATGEFLHVGCNNRAALEALLSA